MERTGVIVTPGSAFGSLGENHVRFALVLNENLIKEAVEKTVEWCKEYLNGADMLEVTDRQIREFFA